jgi:hypothetical protein
MPHVVLEGTVDLQQLGTSFEPLFQRWGNDLLKVDHLYLEQQGEDVLLDTLVVESGHRQHFFIQVTPRKGGAVVRLLPQTDPEKTDGVKRALALVAAWIRGLGSGACHYGSTNLGDFLQGS